MLFAIDILLTFNTVQYDDDFEIITERSQIAFNYITNFFFIDVFAVIHFDWFTGGH